MKKLILLSIVGIVSLTSFFARAQQKPNIILIYADDLGYGDVSCYGATKIKTPHIDKLAAAGLRFTNAHSSSATCTPSRFSMLTGKYAWRQKGTGIAPGDAPLLIPTDISTLPGMLQKAGYQAGVVGKWHLGLGPKGGPDWNADIKPGPLEIGFNYSFLLPATADRVPTVYVENHRIINLDPQDPITISYREKVGNEPTGKENPDMLRMQLTHGHDNTIVNGISRIGFMSGGKTARWIDEEIADVITGKAIQFIKANQKQPFFLYFPTHDIHVPRVPHSRFVGKSGMGPRGDAIMQLDWTVGEIMKTLDQLQLTQNTMVILSSDNGYILDDGYQDEAREKLNGHTPAGPLRGSKYSTFEGGTRVPFILRWPAQVKPGITNALVSHVDFFASFAALTGQKLAPADAPDSFNLLAAFLGKDKLGRDYFIEHGLVDNLAIIKGDWKYIEPHGGPAVIERVQAETGNSSQPQLYHLKKDLSEKNNVAAAHPQITQELDALLKSVRTAGRSREISNN